MSLIEIVAGYRVTSVPFGINKSTLFLIHFRLVGVIQTVMGDWMFGEVNIPQLNIVNAVLDVAVRKLELFNSKFSCRSLYIRFNENDKIKCVNICMD